MKILEQYKVPTGDILIVEGDRGKLEMLSVGDYGKEVNIKADFLGLSREPDRVRHTAMMPLDEKWVITISTQYGCSMGCTFCDVPKVGPGRNATLYDLIGQVEAGMSLHPEIATTKRLNIHFARMGEPSWNPIVLQAAEWMNAKLNPEYHLHPVVSTMMPRDNPWLRAFVVTWMRIKNEVLSGEAGLQLSINTTDAIARSKMFRNNACTLDEISGIMTGIKPVGRKVTLNFAVTNLPIDPNELLPLFDPQHYIIKLTPMHKTATATENGLETGGDYTEFYPYAEHEDRLRSAGYDVLVFLASDEEDISRITCGNAILSDGKVAL